MRRTTLSALIVLTLAGISNANAGLYDDIYRGLEILATPSGSPLQSAADGLRVNGDRRGRVRIVPDAVGNGYSLEFNRSFGADSEGRPETLDLGAYEMQLSGNTAMTLGYTDRGFLAGTAQVAASNLQYSLQAKGGYQDIALTGTLNVGGNLQINQLGFYTLNLQVKNTDSQVIEDGIVVDGNSPTNFDIGPINVKGNIFVDAFVGLLRTLGLDTTALEPLVAKSGIDTLTEALREDMLKLTPALEVAAQSRGDGQLPPVTTPPVIEVADSSTAARVDNTTRVPEPGTLLLASLGGVFLWRWRRH